MKKLLWFFDHLEEIISSVLLFMVFILLGVSIFMRVIGLSASYLQEPIQFGFIVSILFGVSFAAKEREHIRADIITEHVSPKVRKIMLFLSDIVWLFFSLSLVWYSFDFIDNMMKFPQKTPLLDIPYWILYAMVPVSGALTSIRIIQTNIINLRHKPI